MEDNLDIFIITHKPFDNKVSSDVYKIIKCGDDKITSDLKIYYDNVGDNISHLNFLYGEMTAIYWAWKNLKLKKYIGFCHYHRFWDFYDDIPNLDDIFSKYDVIVHKQYDTDIPMLPFYENEHNGEDFKELLQVIKDKYPNLYEKSKYVSENVNIFYPCNMIIMKTEDFYKYCEFMFVCLEEFRKRKGIDTYEDITKHIIKNRDKYIKTYLPNSTIKYQARICGFLSERLFTCYAANTFPNIKEIDVDWYF
jgi:hypothetical protein